MDGSTWKARMKPGDVSPAGPVSPGETAMGPNTKYIPSLAKEITLSTASFSHEKMRTPAGSRKIIKAKAHWRTRPVSINLKLMFFLSLATNHARDIKTKRPKRLISLGGKINLHLPMTPGGQRASRPLPFSGFLWLWQDQPYEGLGCYKS